MKFLIKSLLLSALAAMLITIISCKQKCNGNTPVEISFSGFDSSNLEKIVVKTYVAGSNYSRLVSSKEYLLSQSGRKTHEYDTVQHFVSWPYYNELYLLGNDYEINVINANKTYRVSDFSYSNANSSCTTSGADACRCKNELESYQLDGTVIFTGHSGADYCNSCSYRITLQH